jgi:hypothetical protein
MRLNIKTLGRIKDPDIRALYILNAGMKLSSERMRLANLRFIAETYGFSVVVKEK